MLLCLYRHVLRLVCPRHCLVFCASSARPANSALPKFLVAFIVIPLPLALVSSHCAPFSCPAGSTVEAYATASHTGPLSWCSMIADKRCQAGHTTGTGCSITLAGQTCWSSRIVRLFASTSVHLICFLDCTTSPVALPVTILSSPLHPYLLVGEYVHGHAPLMAMLLALISSLRRAEAVIAIWLASKRLQHLLAINRHVHMSYMTT